MAKPEIETLEPDQSSDVTERKQKPQLFRPGQSGNPAGRPRGARSKLAADFIDGLATEFAEHGTEAIRTVRQKDPGTFLKVIKDVLPREVLLKATLNVTTTADVEDFAQYVSDWRLARQRIGINEPLGAFRPEGTNSPAMIDVTPEPEEVSQFEENDD